MWVALVLAVGVLCAGCADGPPRSASEPPAPIGAEAASAQGAPAGSSAATASAQTSSGQTSSGQTPAQGAAASSASAAGAKRGAAADSSAPLPRPVFKRPEHVRALYLNAWAAGSKKKVDQLIELAQRTEINAFVIDIKDASGYVSQETQVPLAREIGANGQHRIRDLPGLLHRLEAEGIYPIARIVIVRDPLLSAGRPSLAVQGESGQAWHDDKGIVWMNIANEGVWKYNVDLAEEVVKMGFPEIQWDYVRFPDAPKAVMATARFPGVGDGGKPAAVRGFMTYAHKRLDDLGLDVAMTADVFGITATTEDVGIGQIWERFIDKVDVALPMVYPSHYYTGSFGYKVPNAYPYEVVKHALERALERSKAVEGAGRVRPYLQDFSLGPPAYGAPEVRAQIQAAYDAGVEEWVLWNAGSNYTEGALQPKGGWKQEPTIRLADQVVPVSKRFDVLKRIADQEAAQKLAAQQEAARKRAARDSGAAAAKTGPHKLDRKPVSAKAPLKSEQSPARTNRR